MRTANSNKSVLRIVVNQRKQFFAVGDGYEIVVWTVNQSHRCRNMTDVHMIVKTAEHETGHETEQTRKDVIQVEEWRLKHDMITRDLLSEPTCNRGTEGIAPYHEIIRVFLSFIQAILPNA